MKRIKFIINPSSGRQSMEKKVDTLSKLLLDDGYILGKYFTKKKNDASNETIKSCKEDWDLIIVCGGDGTVNEVIEGIMKSKRKLPISILPSGTVNDFASYLRIPKNISDYFQMIKNSKFLDIDVGKLNDEYFANVAAGGILTNVGFQTEVEHKAVFGRMAYYFEGLKEITQEGFNPKPFKVKIRSDEYTSEEEILLFLVSNSSSIGGFKKLAPEADVIDGFLDVIIIRKSPITELANIFFNVLTGEHIKHPNVKYFKTKSISIDTEEDIDVDMDGEYGGKLPATFKAVPSALKILVKEDLNGIWWKW